MQDALLQDPVAPAAMIPLFNVPSHHPDWLYWQRYYLDNPDDYPATGEVSFPTRTVGQSLAQQSIALWANTKRSAKEQSQAFSGIFQRRNEQDYAIAIAKPNTYAGFSCILITLQSEINEQLQNYFDQQPLTVRGRLNQSGGWLVVEEIDGV
jgi:hypothetical protein